MKEEEITEILINNTDYDWETVSIPQISKEIIELHKQNLREELNKFVAWFNKSFDEYINKDEDIVDEYLKEKNDL